MDKPKVGKDRPGHCIHGSDFGLMVQQEDCDGADDQAAQDRATAQSSQTIVKHAIRFQIRQADLVKGKPAVVKTRPPVPVPNRRSAEQAPAQPRERGAAWPGRPARRSGTDIEQDRQDRHQRDDTQ